MTYRFAAPSTSSQDGPPRKALRSKRVRRCARVNPPDEMVRNPTHASGHDRNALNRPICGDAIKHERCLSIWSLHKTKVV